MMEFNREQTIKALECCTNDDCTNCPIRQPNATCVGKLMKNAIALIKELTAENEKLNKLLEHCEDDGEYLEGKYNNAVADTVQKMQEKLKAKSFRDVPVFGKPYSCVDFVIIDQVAKEMLEENR